MMCFQYSRLALWTVLWNSLVARGIVLLGPLAHRCSLYAVWHSGIHQGAGVPPPWFGLPTTWIAEVKTPASASMKLSICDMFVISQELVSLAITFSTTLQSFPSASSGTVCS